MPCWSRFDAQDAVYQDDILPPVAPEQILRVSIEAGTTIGWERYTMVQGLRFGLDRFGASAPAEHLYEYFGLTADAIAPQVITKLKELKA
jgi:transketolase